MKVGIITFHASHNYGSMLQAYALQQTVMKLGHECEIINFRTERQKKFFRPFFMEKRFRAKAKALFYPKMAFNDWRKYRLFERFLKDKFILSEKEYHTSEELANAGLDYDAYISGSDQIWNTHCFDFDWAYYLNFVRKGKKIAYAASMGPRPESDVTDEFDSVIVRYIEKYNAISVREDRTLKRISKAGVKDLDRIVVDPTLLLSCEEWGDLISKQPLIKGEYIYLYTPWYYENVYEDAALLAEKEGLKIVVSKSDGFRKWGKNKKFEFFTAVGPLEFLNLLKFAKIVIAESFHAVVFSLIFNKSLVITNGDLDSRVSSLLSIVKLNDNCKRVMNTLLLDSSYTVDFNTMINAEKQSSIDYLRTSIK